MQHTSLNPEFSMGTKRKSKAIIAAAVGGTITLEVTDDKVTGVVTPGGPVHHTVPADHKSAKMTEKELLKVARLCMLQGSKTEDDSRGRDKAKAALEGLLCCGLESGPYGSATVVEFIPPTAMKGRTIEDEEHEPKLKYRSDPEQVFRHLDWPMNDGGALIMFDKYEYDESGFEDAACYRYTLDYKTLLIGLARLSLDHPRAYSQWISGNYDALTGDALVQCALFGDIVYG